MKSLVRILVMVVFFAGFHAEANAEVIGTVNFDFDSVALTPEARTELRSIAQRISAQDSFGQVSVTGHTDAVGSNAYNDALGLRRAQTVAAALTAEGIAVTRIGTVASRGERDLIVQVSTPERLNRRVTVTHALMLAVCRTYRDVMLPPIEDQFRAGLRQRLNDAVATRSRLAQTGGNTPVYQVAGAAI